MHVNDICHLYNNKNPNLKQMYSTASFELKSSCLFFVFLLNFLTSILKQTNGRLVINSQNTLNNCDLLFIAYLTLLLFKA